MDIATIVNEGYLCMAHENHKCLCSFLLGKSFRPSDMKKEFKYFQSDNLFFEGLCYLSIYKNPEIKDFDLWYENSKNAVTSLAKACSYSFDYGDYEKNFYALALAINTFDCNEKPSRITFDEDTYRKASFIPTTKDERVWAEYITSSVYLDQLESGNEKEKDVSLYIQLLKRTLDIRDSFFGLKMYLYDSEKGRIYYDRRKDLLVDAGGE